MSSEHTNGCYDVTSCLPSFGTVLLLFAHCNQSKPRTVGRCRNEARGRCGNEARGRCGNEARGRCGNEARGRCGNEDRGRCGNEARGRCGNEDRGRCGNKARGRCGNHTNRDNIQHKSRTPPDLHDIFVYTLVASTGWIFSVLVTDASTVSGAVDHRNRNCYHVHIQSYPCSQAFAVSSLWTHVAHNYILQTM